MDAPDSLLRRVAAALLKETPPPLGARRPRGRLAVLERAWAAARDGEVLVLFLRAVASPALPEGAAAVAAAFDRWHPGADAGKRAIALAEACMDIREAVPFPATPRLLEALGIQPALIVPPPRQGRLAF